jgi:hypothetical protein
MPRTDANHRLVAALLIWILVQWLAVCCCAARVRFWIAAPAPMEHYAVQVLVLVQVLTATLAAPVLASTWVRFGFVALSIAPFAALAELLAAAERLPIARAEIYVIAWIGLLTVWFTGARGSATRAIIVSLIGACTLGGVACWYVLQEFIGTQTSMPAIALRQTPILAAVDELLRGAAWRPSKAMVVLLVLLMASLAVRFAWSRARRASGAETI